MSKMRILPRSQTAASRKPRVNSQITRDLISTATPDASKFYAAILEVSPVPRSSGKVKFLSIVIQTLLFTYYTQCTSHACKYELHCNAYIVNILDNRRD